MQILFLHDNFPAQFGVFGQYLARCGWDVWFGTQRKGARLPGLKTFQYAPHRKVTAEIHPYVAGFEKAVLNGQGLGRAALRLKDKGLNPDIVMAHSGWGPGLYVKDIWPTAKYVGYFEWYYKSNAPDLVFLGEQDRDLDSDLRTRTRNASIQMDLINCDAGLCPTEFQKEQFPDCLRGKLKVMHDGIDTDMCKPASDADRKIADIDLTQASEIVTYVARGMEPYRGFPEFMKAAEHVLAKRPDAHIVIVGEDRVAYGKKLENGDSFKKRALDGGKLDHGRVHFTGILPRTEYLKVLQASSVHVYLTVPFVLSWSMMEAMSAGCAIVSSDVRPVSEVAGGDSAAIVQIDHRNPENIAAAVVDLLENREKARAMGAAARAFIQENYSAKKLFAEKEAWLTSL